MKIVVADTGALISLGHVDKIDIIEKVLGQFHIPDAVWKEISSYNHPNFNKQILTTLASHISYISSNNHLTELMDYGESEAVILYKDLNADFLLIDDNKARAIAESMQINCIGSLGLLIRAKQLGLLKELKPIFESWIYNRRYFAIHLFNTILEENGETKIGKLS